VGSCGRSPEYLKKRGDSSFTDAAEGVGIKLGGGQPVGANFLRQPFDGKKEGEILF